MNFSINTEIDLSNLNPFGESFFLNFSIFLTNPLEILNARLSPIDLEPNSEKFVFRCNQITASVTSSDYTVGSDILVISS